MESMMTYFSLYHFFLVTLQHPSTFSFSHHCNTLNLWSSKCWVKERISVMCSTVIIHSLVLLKKKSDSKVIKTFYSRTIAIGEKYLSIEQYSSQFWIHHRWVGIYSQGAAWGSVDGKLLRGNIRGREGFWLNRPNRISAEARLIRYQGEEGGISPDIEDIWIMSHGKDRGFSVNIFSSILAKTG